MDITEAIKVRHSVRSFTDQKIEGEVESRLRDAIDEVNKESGLHIQLCLNEPEAFQASKPNYGSFKNCRNYIAIVTKPGTDEECGYYGERIVLLAQTLGLNTCWVVLTYKKGKAVYLQDAGEKLRIVIALGYGDKQGSSRKSKPIEKLCQIQGDMSDWARAGMESVALAPTAMNQQRFLFVIDGNVVSAKTLPSFVGNTKIDLGIAKYHFEVGAGKDNFHWAR